MKIALIAKRAFTHRGRTYQAGERFEIAPVDAAALRYQGLAAFVPRDTPPPDEPEKPSTKGRTYKRRDLQAED